MQDESAGSLRVSMVSAPVNRSVSKECAKLHRQEIPDGFLPTFGIGFLSHLYEHIATSEKSFLIVASRQSEVCGFICGSYGTGSLYKSFMARKFIKILVPVAIRLINPGVLNKIIETLKYPAGESIDDLPGSEILNFCVSSDIQGEGIGQTLFQAMCEEFHDKGISRIRIVTGSNQVSAKRFYLRAGAVKAADINVHGNISSEIYVYTLKDSGA